MVGRGPAGPHARPDRDAHRGHRRAVPAPPEGRTEVDEGYRGLANGFPDQVSAPPKKPKDDAPFGEQHAWREMRRRQSSNRICVEHANAELRQWCPLQRYTGRREDYPETHQAIASLVSDRAARRAIRRKPSAELVLAQQVIY